MSLSTAEAACVYAALILQDEGLEITADKITALIAAAGVEVQPIWPTIFAKALAGKDLEALLFSAGSSGSGSAPVAGGAQQAPGAAAVEEKAESEKADESDDDMGFGLFD
jgi:large subunit ribosomal protein LP1